MSNPSITVDQVFDALIAFLAPFFPGVEIVRLQENRVAPPPLPFIGLNEIGMADIEVVTVTHDPNAQTSTYVGPKRLDVQVASYGSASGDWANIIVTMFRSDYASDQFPDGIKPLWADDAVQVPLITGANQYETRWTTVVHLQYNALITVGQQSATALELNQFVDVP